MAANATSKKGTKKSSAKKVVLTDEQKGKVIDAIKGGHKLAWLDRDVLGLTGRASYVAVREAAVEHFGSIDKVNAAIKAAQPKGEAKATATKAPAKKAEAKSEATTPAPAKSEAKPDPKPAAKRTTRRAAPKAKATA